MGKLIDTIDDPVGLRTTGLDETGSREFIEYVQEVRWTLWAWLVDMDAQEGVTEIAEDATTEAIRLLGVAARAEAAFVDYVPEEDGNE